MIAEIIINSNVKNLNKRILTMIGRPTTERPNTHITSTYIRLLKKVFKNRFVEFSLPILLKYSPIFFWM